MTEHRKPRTLQIVASSVRNNQPYEAAGEALDLDLEVDFDLNELTK